MAEDKRKQLQAVDLVGIGNLLEDLIVKDIITCEERDKIIQRIVMDNDFPNYRQYRKISPRNERYNQNAGKLKYSPGSGLQAN